MKFRASRQQNAGRKEEWDMWGKAMNTLTGIGDDMWPNANKIISSSMQPPPKYTDFLNVGHISIHTFPDRYRLANVRHSKPSPSSKGCSAVACFLSQV